MVRAPLLDFLLAQVAVGAAHAANDGARFGSDDKNVQARELHICSFRDIQPIVRVILRCTSMKYFKYPNIAVLRRCPPNLQILCLRDPKFPKHR